MPFPLFPKLENLLMLKIQRKCHSQAAKLKEFQLAYGFPPTERLKISSGVHYGTEGVPHDDRLSSVPAGPRRQKRFWSLL
ncbi:hypothetical protein H8959_002909 [Pygathrix nigripes]